MERETEVTSIRIGRVDPDAPSGYAPLLSGADRTGANLFCLGAEREGLAAGAMLVKYENDRFLIRWIHVAAPLRHQGIGAALIRELIRIAEEKGVGRIGMNICVEDRELPAAAGFLTSQGFVLTGQYPSWHVELGTLERKRSGMRKLTLSQDVHFLEEVSDRELKGLPVFVRREGLLEESSFYVKNGKVLGACLLEPLEEDVLLRYLFNRGPETAPLRMLSASYQKLFAGWPPETKVYMTALTQPVKRFTEKFAEGALKEEPGVRLYAREIRQEDDAEQNET